MLEYVYEAHILCVWWLFLCVNVSVLQYNYVLICCMYIFTIKTQRVNVYKNDDMTWDFTVQGEEALSCAY